MSSIIARLVNAAISPAWHVAPGSKIERALWKEAAGNYYGPLATNIRNGLAISIDQAQLFELNEFLNDLTIEFIRQIDQYLRE